MILMPSIRGRNSPTQESKTTRRRWRGVEGEGERLVGVEKGRGVFVDMTRHAPGLSARRHREAKKVLFKDASRQRLGIRVESTPPERMKGF